MAVLKDLPRYTNTTDGSSYIVVGEASRDPHNPFISVLCSNFSHYVNIHPDMYQLPQDLLKARVGDIIKCYHDDDDKIIGMHICCGDSYTSRENLFNYFSSALDETSTRIKAKDKLYSLPKCLCILSDCLTHNARSFETTNPEVFSLSRYCAQLRRIGYFTDKLYNATTRSAMKEDIAELSVIADNADIIFRKGRKYGDFRDARPDRMALPVEKTKYLEQTSLDNFVKR